MSNKEEYRLFCESEKNIPIYSQYWWMEAVCAGKAWDVLLIRNDKQEVIASLPYLLDQKHILTYVQMPILTQTNGIYIKEGEDDHKEIITKEILSQIDRLKLDAFYQNFPPEPDVQGSLQKDGYTIKERITYVIEDLTDTDKVFKSFDASKQRQIKKAIRNGLCVHYNKMNAEQFYEYHNNLYIKRNLKNQISRNAFLLLAKTSIEKGQGGILNIEGTDGKTQSALFMVWDNQKCYYLVPANDRDYSKTGAPTMLTWEAIKWAAANGKSFDFEGSMIPSIAKNYSQFGSAPVTYLQAVKTFTLMGKIWEKIRLK